MAGDRGVPIFSGVGVALLTLFDEGGNVDVQATAEHAARLVDLGVKAVAVLGTTGEPWLLSEQERVDLIEACRSAVPAEVPVIAGTGHPDIEGAVRLTRDAKSAGAVVAGCRGSEALLRGCRAGGAGV